MKPSLLALLGCLMGVNAFSFAYAQPTVSTPPTVLPIKRWAIKPALTDKKEAENISAIACSSPSLSVCVLVSDEQKRGRYVRVVRLDAATMVPERQVEILAGDGKEADTEGADYADGRFYVVGSHGVTKKDGTYQEERYLLFRFAPSASTSAEVERTSKLEAVIAAQPELRAQACTRTALAKSCKTLQKGGVNVEGLAVRDGKAWLGLRAPAPDGVATVLTVAVKPLFNDGDPPKAQLYRVPVGAGRGIRDMTRVSGGFLLLTGKALPEEDGEHLLPATVLFWPGDQTAPRPIATLGGAGAESKPEALLLMAEDPSAWQVLVLSDGRGGDEPMEYRLVR